MTQSPENRVERLGFVQKEIVRLRKSLDELYLDAPERMDIVDRIKALQHEREQLLDVVVTPIVNALEEIFREMKSE